ncbi:MAG: C39 family peptidase [Clostridium sp.]|jgi:hypothetical protein|nr:C39 family peptidase [Clostridium sp.]
MIRKNFQKAASILLSIILLFSCGLPSFATSVPNTDDHAPMIGEISDNLEKPAYITQKESVAFSYYLEKMDSWSNIGIMRGSANEYEAVLSLSQVPQDTSTYCGFAAVKSVLTYKAVHLTQTQANIKTQAETLCNDTGEDSLPWYIGNGTSYSTNFFPAAAVLNYYLGYHYYTPFGPWSSAMTTSSIEAKIVYDIDQSLPVLVCGVSGPNSAASHMPNYPNSNKSHWLVVKGYSDYGDTIVIADPAKSSAVSWSSNISAVYTVSIGKITDYANATGASGYSARGLIW